MNSHILRPLLCLLALLTAPLSVRAADTPPNPDLTKGTTPGKAHDWTLGSTGARGWIFTANGHSRDARQILVTEVAKGSPADGVLENGDVILGLDGKNFAEDARVAFAKGIAAAEADYGYVMMFLAEYVMATGDQSVVPGLTRLALETARGQSGVGTWGHRFAEGGGNLGGYGAMNAPGLSLTIGMVLAREAGVRDSDRDRAIAKSAAFLRWFVNKGAIPYGDHQPFFAHENKGKCAAAAVLFDLLGDREAAEFFAKMSAAAYSERERGHTGNFFNMLWALSGVARCGPLTTGAYLREHA